jgi:hypothetical protein
MSAAFDRTRGRLLEHFPEKWTPVFDKEMRQHKDS